MRSAKRGHSDLGRFSVPRLKTSRWRGPYCCGVSPSIAMGV